LPWACAAGIATAAPAAAPVAVNARLTSQATAGCPRLAGWWMQRVIDSLEAA
jgi:hypothetical protein